MELEGLILMWAWVNDKQEKSNAIHWQEVYVTVTTSVIDTDRLQC